MSTLSTLSPATTDRRRWIALIVVCLAMLMNALDSSIVNVALPSIQRELHFSSANLTWVVDAYLIAFGSFLLLAGRLGDLIGRKKVFLSGVTLFTLASSVCALAQNQSTLIAARFVQGLGGAISTSVIVAIIVTEFTGASERAKAMSAYLFVAVGGGSIGLLVGGILTQAVNWHWIFLINVPIGIATLVLGSFLIRENEGLGVREGLDITGSLLMTRRARAGDLRPRDDVDLRVAERAHDRLRGRGDRPHERLRRRRVAARQAHRAAATPSPAQPDHHERGSRLTFAAMYAVFFFGALFFERVLGYDPLHTGIAFLPMSLVMAAMSLGLTSRLLARFGPMRLLVPGMTAVVVGLLALSRLGADAHYATAILPALLLIGVGMSVSAVPLLTIAMADVPKSDAGVASGLVNVSMWLASSTGLAVFGSVAASRTRHALAQGQSASQSLVTGYHEIFFIGAALSLIGLVVTVVAAVDAGRA